MPDLAERGMAVGLRRSEPAGQQPADRPLGLRDPAERVLREASKTTVRTATRAGRTFAATQRLSKPARQPRAGRSDLFDLTPDDEQQMLRESVRDFALAKLRPAAEAADDACAAPDELLAQANELGLTMVGVPEELGGAVAERSAVTTVLMSEALAQGDMGIALACLAPAAVSTALSLWGDADQQATYLPEFVGENVPAAALAVLEPRPLFNPFDLKTRARRVDGGFVLDGVKSLVPRASASELFVIAASLEGTPALFVVEPGGEGLSVEPEPAMGLRAAATGRLVLEQVKLPAGALLGEPGQDTVSECIQLGRLGWCALAVGTGQAVLDYVIPYVNERTAFGEPICVATVRGLHGREHRDRARRHAPGHLPRGQPRRSGDDVRARGRAGPPAVRRARHGDRLRRRAVARRPRLRQGASGRALVPRPARGRRDGGRAAEV